MDIFDNTAANGTFGSLAFAFLGTIVIVAGFKYRWLRAKKTLIIAAASVLLITVNSAGWLGEIAGALRGGMNNGGQKAVEELAGAKAAPNPQRTDVPPVNAGGALLGLGGVAWYVVKIVAAKGKPKDLKEMCIGAGVAVCYGTSVGFLGIVVGATVVTGNNVGLWAFGG